MIDTVKLRIKDFEVENSAPIQVDTVQNIATGEISGEKLLFRTKDGRSYFGKRAYMNADLFNIDFRGEDAYLKFSVPKVYSGGEDNLQAVSGDGAVEVFESVENILREKGVHFDILESVPSRVDLFKNIKTERSFDIYSNLFRMFSGKRTYRREYGTTFLWNNTLRELCIYDKIEEMRRTGKAKDLSDENIMRVEYRMLKGRKCASDLKVSDVRTLLKNWNYLPVIYSEKVKDLIFDVGDLSDLEKTFVSDETERIEYFRENGGRYWFKKYKDYLGSVAIFEKFGDEKRLREKLSEFITDRSEANRIVRKLKKERILAPDTISAKVSLAELYKELYSKMNTDE